MAYVDDSRDPFSGGEKVPSLSWNGLPHGSVFTLEVLEPAKAIQTRNFDTNEPDYWPSKQGEPRNPKMSAVLNVRVLQGPHSVGEDRSIWATIPSNLFVALKEAQKAAGVKFAPGGMLHLKLTGEIPHEDKRKNPIKQYAAKYTPPDVAQGPDPFAGQAATGASSTTPQPWMGSAPQAPQPFTRPRPVAPATTTAPGTKPKGW